MSSVREKSDESAETTEETLEETKGTDETEGYSETTSDSTANTIAEQTTQTEEVTKGGEDGSCDTEKDNTIKCKPFNFVDNPNKPEIPSPYIHRSAQLEKTNKKFTFKDFQAVRNISNRQEVIEAYRRIGTIINDVNPNDLPRQEMENVCFILVNSCNTDHDYYGYGPFNDAYMIAKFHKDLGYNIALIYNPKSEVFMQFLEYFLTYTTKNLTFYYTGRDSITKKNIDHGIRFNDDTVVYQDDLAKIFYEKCREKTKIIVLSDCASSDSIINMDKIKSFIEDNTKPFVEIVNFSLNKKKLKANERKLTHGLLTFFYCTFIRHYPHCTLKELDIMLHGSYLRFKIPIKILCTNDILYDQIFYDKAVEAFGDE